MILKNEPPVTLPFNREQLEWIIDHMRLTRKGKKLAKALKRGNKK